MYYNLILSRQLPDEEQDKLTQTWLDKAMGNTVSGVTRKQSDNRFATKETNIVCKVVERSNDLVDVVQVQNATLSNGDIINPMTGEILFISTKNCSEHCWKK